MYIEVNNIRLYYRVKGEGKNIILLSGNGTYTGYMKKLFKELAKNYKVYLVDRRCQGKSTRDCSLTYEETAEDIYKFIIKLNIDNPIVLGHSGGGTTVLHLALKHQDKLSKIVLCSAVARYDRKISETLLEKILKKIPVFPGKSSLEKFEKLVEEARTISEEELKTIHIPALVVNGDRDIVPVEEAKYISKSLKKCNLLILEKENHQSYMTKNNWFIKLKDFIENKKN